MIILHDVNKNLTCLRWPPRCPQHHYRVDPSLAWAGNWASPSRKRTRWTDCCLQRSWSRKLIQKIWNQRQTINFVIFLGSQSRRTACAAPLLWIRSIPPWSRKAPPREGWRNWGYSVSTFLINIHFDGQILLIAMLESDATLFQHHWMSCLLPLNQILSIVHWVIVVFLQPDNIRRAV